MRKFKASFQVAFITYFWACAACGTGNNVSPPIPPLDNIVRLCDGLINKTIKFDKLSDTIKEEIKIKDYASCLKEGDGLGYAITLNAPKAMQKEVLDWLTSIFVSEYKILPKTTPEAYYELKLVRVTNSFHSTCKDWQDLISHRPNKEIQDSIMEWNKKNFSRGMTQSSYRYPRISPVESAGERIINLDLYKVIVYKLPLDSKGTGNVLSGLQILKNLIANINQFTPEGTNFYHYCDSVTAEQKFDPVCINADIKVSPQIYPGEIIHIELSKRWIGSYPQDDGSVIVTKSYFSETESDVIFSTAYTEKDGEHPVSGNRNFGFKTFGSQDSPVVILYIRGADRPTHTMSDTVRDKILDGGDQVWLSVQKNLTEKINANGGKAEILRQLRIYRPNWEDVKTQCHRPVVDWDERLILGSSR